jgi:hypothetical protein
MNSDHYLTYCSWASPYRTNVCSSSWCIDPIILTVQHGRHGRAYNANLCCHVEMDGRGHVLGCTQFVCSPSVRIIPSGNCSLGLPWTLITCTTQTSETVILLSRNSRVRRLSAASTMILSSIFVAWHLETSKWCHLQPHTSLLLDLKCSDPPG